MLLQDLYITRNICEGVWLTSMMLASKEAELAQLYFPLVPQVQGKTGFIIVIFLPIYLQKTKKLLLSYYLFKCTTSKPEAWQSL